jgi:hypothetical protein
VDLIVLHIGSAQRTGQNASISLGTVAVEEMRDQAKVRRADAAACDPESGQVLASAVVQDELQEQAAECVAPREALLPAETDELVETPGTSVTEELPC